MGWIAETALSVDRVGSRDGGSCEGRDLVQAMQAMKNVNAMKDGKSSGVISNDDQ